MSVFAIGRVANVQGFSDAHALERQKVLMTHLKIRIPSIHFFSIRECEAVPIDISQGPSSFFELVTDTADFNCNSHIVYWRGSSPKQILTSEREGFEIFANYCASQSRFLGGNFNIPQQPLNILK